MARLVSCKEKWLVLSRIKDYGLKLFEQLYMSECSGFLMSYYFLRKMASFSQIFLKEGVKGYFQS
jgi:hypothetical protein